MYKLLVVDDEMHLVDRIAETIPWRELGIETVYRAYSGKEALEIVQDGPVDIVISDIRMPGLSGLELIERIRAQWQSVKSILLTGYGDFKYTQRAIEQRIGRYLLKPASNEEIMEAVASLIAAIQSEWEAVASKRKAELALREHLPILRSNLLNELLLGRSYPADALAAKLQQYELPVAMGDETVVMLVRMEEAFANYDGASLSLLEYGVGNIAEEVFAEDYALWSAKDTYEYLVFVVKNKEPSSAPNDDGHARLEKLAELLQLNVRRYLKGAVSVLVSPRHAFPAELSAVYRQCLAAFRRQIGSGSELLLTLDERAAHESAQSLNRAYEPFTLGQLLESANWELAESKLEAVLGEVEERFPDSHEHLAETTYAVAGSFLQFAHKHGRSMEELLGREYDKVSTSVPFRTVSELKRWSSRTFGRLRDMLRLEETDSRARLVRSIRQYVEAHLEGDISLQAIADHVGHHPTNVSRLYKAETGEGLSDYIYELRMRHAEDLLRNTDLRIYEISSRLGYQNPQYFIKLFRKRFGLTPQEFRDKMTLLIRRGTNG